MKKAILGRYARTDDGRVVLDVSANRVPDLYNDFDRTSPYRRKDLDQDLVDYLIGCVREIGREPFVLRFNMASHPSEAERERVRLSVRNYFTYMVHVERHSLGRTFRTSLILLCVGLALLALSVWATHATADGGAVLHEVIAQGITVAAWVSLWEAIAIFLIQWPPFHARIQRYRRLASADVLFREDGAREA